MRESASLPRTDRSRNSRGFSFVELLAVVAIIAVLIAVLLPAFQGVKQKAEQVACSGRLRQWGIALNLYAADHKGFFPPTWIKSRVNFSTFTAPYLQQNWFKQYAWDEWRIDVTKAGCPTYHRIQSKKLPNHVFHPYCYNSARMDYAWYWKTFGGPDPSTAIHYNNLSFVANPMPPYQYDAGGSLIAPAWNVFPFEQARDWHGQWGVPGKGISRMERRYIGQTGFTDGTDADTIGFYQKRNVPHTKLYDTSQSIAMFCGGYGAHWKFGVYPNVAPWSSHNWWGSDGWKSRLPHMDYHEEVKAVHGNNLNFLFMDGHIENLNVNEPRIDFYMYNRIPAKGNPWPS